MGYLEKFTKDQSIIRKAIIGTLRYLNNVIEYEYQISDNESKVVKIAWFYSKANSERFYQDLFLTPGWSDCKPDFIEGDYDYIPRGTLNISAINIPVNNITSGFAKMERTEYNNGAISKRVSEVKSIPFQITLQGTLICDNLNEAFGITENLIKTLYKNIVFHIQYEGYSVPCRVGLPDNYDMEKAEQISFENTENIKVQIPLEMELYKPITNTEEDRLASNRITNFETNFHLGKELEQTFLTAEDILVKISNSDFTYTSSNLNI